MGIVHATFVRCDVCNKDDATTFVITPDGDEPREVDLCPRHKGPVFDLWEKGRKASRSRTQSKRPRLEDLEVVDLD